MFAYILTCYRSSSARAWSKLSRIQCYTRVFMKIIRTSSSAVIVECQCSLTFYPCSGSFLFAQTNYFKLLQLLVHCSPLFIVRSVAVRSNKNNSCFMASHALQIRFGRSENIIFHWFSLSSSSLYTSGIQQNNNIAFREKITAVKCNKTLA